MSSKKNCQAAQDEPVTPGHVHFNPDQVSHHDLEILIDASSNGFVDVHLGFLQVNHVYEVDVPIEAKNHRLGSAVEVCSDSDGLPISNFFVRLKSHQPGDSTTSSIDVFRFELFAHKERLLKETITLKGVGDDSPKGMQESEARLTVVFHARVLGKLKGTPALKNGIRCIGMRSEDDGSEFCHHEQQLPMATEQLELGFD